MKRVVPVLALILAIALTPALTWAQSNERGIDLQNFDDDCTPCTDFDQHANGSWKTNNPIPQEYPQWGTWQEVRERNLNTVRTILERTASEEHAKGSVEHKVGQYYRLAMAKERIEADGAKPLHADLLAVNNLNSADDLRAFIAECHARDIGLAFGIGVEQDLVESDKYIVYLTQGGLGLPDRDYYTKEDEASVTIRRQYVDHMTNMFKLLGDDETTSRATAESVLAFETRMAEASMTRVEMRNPEVYYNIKTVSEASAATPNMNWSAYFTALGLDDLATFSFAQPTFFDELNTMLEDAGLEAWQAYLRWHVLTDAAPYLSSAFVNEDFNFYRKTLRGAEEIQPRWKRVQTSMNWKLGEAVGKLYVAEAFPPEAKQRALKMIGDLRSALQTRLESLEWMGVLTKQKALAKLATFTPKIGYPDTWRDYGAWEVSDDSYLANVRRADVFEFRRNLDKLGKPIDRTEWGMGPQIVNAYYNPLLNEIVFPAAILQPPFFDFTIDDAVNYGAMGAVIGHELLHGFDDQGRKFDAQGSMTNWWTEEDEEKFTARAQRLINQFDKYEVAEDTHVNGELTLGENIADLGGLTMAYYALQIALGDGDRERIDGLTPEQRYFLSWAQVWRANARDESLKMQVNTDSHSPARYRINGPLSNMPEFYKAFGCEEGDGMVNPTNTRVTIW